MTIAWRFRTAEIYLSQLRRLKVKSQGVGREGGHSALRDTVPGFLPEAGCPWPTGTIFLSLHLSSRVFCLSVPMFFPFLSLLRTLNPTTFGSISPPEKKKKKEH
jgi:hypothetical protein